MATFSVELGASGLAAETCFVNIRRSKRDWLVSLELLRSSGSVEPTKLNCGLAVEVWAELNLMERTTWLSSVLGLEERPLLTVMSKGRF
jgi:hypothetical protein